MKSHVVTTEEPNAIVRRVARDPAVAAASAGRKTAPRAVQVPFAEDPAAGPCGGRARFARSLALASMCLWGLACEADPPLPGYEPDPAVFAEGTTESAVVTVPEQPGLEAPVDHMILLLEESADRSVAEDVSASLGGTIVGQIEEIGFYQLKLPTRSMSELGAAIATARAVPGVESAGYDYLARPRACPARSDIDSLPTEAACVWSTADYQQALTAFEELDLRDRLSPVRVGLVDTGLARSNGEFDRVTIANAQASGGDPRGLRDPGGHGTMVAGVIAADDDDGGVNGIASRFLGERLTLVWGGSNGQGNPSHLLTAKLLTALWRAIDAGARVVNMSFGYGPFDPETAWDSIAARNLLQRLFRHFPNVLFVAAAPNDPVELTDNDAPAGIVAPNVLTVGASAACTPTARDPRTAFGARVEIVAQGDRVPLVDPETGRPVVVDWGTSFAAPQVASAAAILASIEPGLSAAEIKSHLLQTASAGPSDTRARSLNIAQAIHQLLLDSGSEFAAELDENDDGLADRPGSIVGRLCGGSTYTVDGIGSYVYPSEETEDGVLATASITEEGFGMALQRPGSDSLAMLCQGCMFDLASYTVDPETGVSIAFVQGTPGSGAGATGVSGTWRLTECTIVDRQPFIISRDDTPLTVMVSSRAEGVFEGGDGSDEPRNLAFSGTFEVPFIAAPLDPDHPVVQTLETVCENGRMR